MKLVKHVIVGTAGHIDHGKTTLVHALTGIDTDRLKEEKERGITVDLGFAHLRFAEYQLGFIDVPGHEKFVRNMLAGAGNVQLVLLVVAADESVMPQTREHFEICRLLDIRDGIVVITKSDLADELLIELVKSEVRQLVADTPLEQAPIVAVDSVSGTGIAELLDLIATRVQEMNLAGRLDPETDRINRLAIDRVFTIKGFGTVVTGSSRGSPLASDINVTIYPRDLKAKVRGIEAYGEATEAALSGQRTALNLTGVERDELARGMVISSTPGLQPTQILDAWFRLLPNAPAPLEDHSPIRLHHGSAELVGRIYLLGGPRLDPGNGMLVQLRVDSPILAFPGDRYVLRRYSPITTIGGGILLDTLAEKHRKKDFSTLLPSLLALASAASDRVDAWHQELIDFLVRRYGSRPLSSEDLTARTGLVEDRLAGLIRTSQEALVISWSPLQVVSRRDFSKRQENVTKFLENFHNSNRLAAGASREEVRERFFGDTQPSYFQFFLTQMSEQGQIRLEKGLIRLEGREATLAGLDRRVRGAILEAFDQDSLQPPSLSDLCERLDHPPDRIRDVFYFLVQQGELIKISDSMALRSRDLKNLISRLKKEFSNRGSFTVPEFKELFAFSRKFAIPILEYLDREKVTRRSGDARTLNE